MPNIDRVIGCSSYVVITRYLENVDSSSSENETDSAARFFFLRLSFDEKGSVFWLVFVEDIIGVSKIQQSRTPPSPSGPTRGRRGRAEPRPSDRQGLEIGIRKR